MSCIAVWLFFEHKDEDNNGYIMVYNHFKTSASNPYFGEQNRIDSKKSPMNSPEMFPKSMTRVVTRDP
jgi:hypothetical protein